ncbi:MAG: metallophosphoesterase [Candidatus Korobacteraceae bacterium]
MPAKSHSRSAQPHSKKASSQKLPPAAAALPPQSVAPVHSILKPGEVRSRPPQGKAQAHPGVHPLLPLASKQKFQPLPDPLGQPPYHYELEAVLPGITAQATQQGHLVFHCVGDTGGINNPVFQTAVAEAMKADLELPAASVPSFFYHLGDVVYFNGQVTDYYSQFYDPYNHYTVPIISIPGNHDGDPINSSQVSLDGWVRYFMQPDAHVNPESGDAPRATMSQPFVYFTLDCPFVTIVGMYTNVPEGGSIDSVQQQWLTNEFATAPEDKALIVALHHPIYSFDAYHSGSARMADAVQHAINDSRRVPNMVFTAHVHNYQRFERDLVSDSATPFLVIGHGGYYNLHSLTASPGTTDPDTQATLVAGKDKQHGYSIITVDAENISGTMNLVEDTKSSAEPDADSFSYPAQAVYLPPGVTVSL